MAVKLDEFFLADSWTAVSVMATSCSSSEKSKLSNSSFASKTGRFLLAEAGVTGVIIGPGGSEVAAVVEAFSLEVDEGVGTLASVLPTLSSEESPLSRRRREVNPKDARDFCIVVGVFGGSSAPSPC